MLEIILIAFIVAKVKGYKIGKLFKSWPIYVVLSFELVYQFFQVTVYLGNYSFVKYGGTFKALYLASFLVLILMYKQYANAIIGSIFIFIGSMLNNFVIVKNGGKMPVFPTLSYITGYASKDSFTKVNDIHILGNASTHYKILTDFIDIGFSILSIGDVLIKVFVFLVIYGSVRYLNEQCEQNADKRYV